MAASAPFGVWVALPLLAWALASLLFVEIGLTSSLRVGAILGATAAAAYLVLATELLSTAHAIDRPHSIATWVAALLLVAIPLARGRARRVRARLNELRDSPLILDPFVRGSCAGIAAIFLALLVIALAAPPNTWDSMTYHMSRVAHWIQNRSVANYPTHDVRQLFLGPGGEFAILHLQILSGGDRFANLPQWLACGGCLVGVSLIARDLGGDARTQAFAAVFSATLPMGILQSASTQNVYVVSFWLVALVVCGLAWARAEGPGLAAALFTGLALGLAVLTKETAYLFAPPLLVWVCLRRRAWRTRRFLELAALLLAAAAPNLGHALRNAEAFGNPLGPSTKAYTNEVWSPPVVASNLIRNLGVHIETQMPAVDERIQHAIEAMHRPLGLDPSDARTTYASRPFKISGPSLSEDTTGNPLHLVLLLGLVVAAVVGRRWRGWELMGYAAALLAGLLAFCLVLRWQPWHSRLHLPLFVLSAPLAALLLRNAAPRRLPSPLTALLFLAALPWVLIGDARPLVGTRSVLTVPRADQYFANRPELRRPYEWAASRVEALGCEDVGLILGGDDWEYPLWALLGSRRAEGLRLHHVVATGDAAECIVSSDADALSTLVDDAAYERPALMDPLVVLRRRS